MGYLADIQAQEDLDFIRALEQAIDLLDTVLDVVDVAKALGLSGEVELL
jgi:hypothetical protein